MFYWYLFYAHALCSTGQCYCGRDELLFLFSVLTWEPFPVSILIFIVDPVHPLNCVYFVIFILALQQFDGNILGPKILGNSTGLSGFWVIFAITFFGGLFGVVGMIVGVPIFAVIYAAIKSLINALLQKKKLPVESQTYERLDYMDEDGDS